MNVTQQPRERVPDEWTREKRELERKMRELQIAMEEEKRVRVVISENVGTFTLEHQLEVPGVTC